MLKSSRTYLISIRLAMPSTRRSNVEMPLEIGRLGQPSDTLTTCLAIKILAGDKDSVHHFIIIVEAKTWKFY